MKNKNTKNTKAKTPKQSAVQSRYLLMPNHANPHGTAFGGVIAGWIDMTASMAAQRHSCQEVVTAGIDSLIFKEPIRIGDHVILKATVNYVGRTSMEVGVKVIKENPYSSKQVTATSAHLTFVALDENKKPTKVPPIRPQTNDEKRRYENAKMRVKYRKKLLRKMK